MNNALIFAGGIGARMGANIPKQFLEIDGVPILVKTIKKFQDHDNIDNIYVVMVNDYIEYTNALIEKYQLDKVACIVAGGATGQDSIYNGLKKMSEDCSLDSIVLIHDGVRPIITSDLITDNIDAVKRFGNAVTCKKCTETIITTKPENKVRDIVDRKKSLTAQAPQSFILGDILAAHETIRKNNPKYEGIIDSCTLMRTIKKDLHIIMGNDDNLKVTTKKDYLTVKALLSDKNTDITKDAYEGFNFYMNNGKEK